LCKRGRRKWSRKKEEMTKAECRVGLQIVEVTAKKKRKDHKRSRRRRRRNKDSNEKICCEGAAKEP
jgi:hypothetical protein